MVEKVLKSGDITNISQTASRHDSILIPIRHPGRPPRVFDARCSVPPSEHPKADAMSVRRKGAKMLGRIVRKRASPSKAKAKVAPAPRGGRDLGGGRDWNADFQGVEVSFIRMAQE